MPANLPPQYFETEKKLKTAKTAQEKIAILEELLSIVPKHKGTEKLQAQLKSKIAKFRAQSQKKPAVSKRGPSLSVEKAGAGQIILVGPPNSGKSSLIKALTNAHPEIGDYPFTTRFPYPAMMKYENIQIQLVDIPPVSEDFLEPWQAEIIKASDGILFVLNASSTDPVSDYLEVLAKLEEKRIEFVPEDKSVPPEKNQFQKRTLIALNKFDLHEASSRAAELKEAVSPHHNLILISALSGTGLSSLKEKIYSFLRILRVYSKIPGKKAELSEPFIFKQGSTLMDMARAVHKDFAEKLKYARIWGKVKFDGQKVTREYILHDEDIIELHI
ncbi:MAG: GTPase [Acidobacteriota bacterium]